MSRHSPLLFSASEITVDNDSALDRVGKIIEGETQFNKLLIEEVMRSEGGEFFRIGILLYFESKLIQTLELSNPTTEAKPEIKKEIVDKIIHDYKDYQELNAYFSDKNFDSLYLLTHIAKEKMALGLSGVKVKAIQIWLEFLGVSKQESKRVAKKNMKLLYKKDSTSPITANLRSLEEILELLKPFVSPFCFSFVDGCKIISLKDSILIAEMSEELKTALRRQSRKLSESMKSIKDVNLNLLFNKYLEIEKFF